MMVSDILKIVVEQLDECAMRDGFIDMVTETISSVKEIHV